MQRVRKLWSRLWRRRSDSDPGRSADGPPGLSSSVAAPTRLIVGLGNPGDQYARTRHNVGFRVVDLLADRFSAEWVFETALDARTCRIELGGESCLLVQPQSFMNVSGAATRAVLDRWPSLEPATDLLIIYDDMDLPTGRIRLRPRGGDGGHRGIGDILRELETKEVPRLRVGVGHPGSSEKVVGWVLDAFSVEEEALVLPELLRRSADAVEATIRDGVVSAMGRFNAA